MHLVYHHSILLVTYCWLHFKLKFNPFDVFVFSIRGCACMWIVLLLRHASLFSFLNYPFPQHCWKGYIVKVLFMRQFRFIILWSTMFIPRLISALVTSEIQIRKWHCGHFKHYSNMKFNIKPIHLFIHLLLSFLPALSAHTSHALAVSNFQSGIAVHVQYGVP